MDTVFVLIIFCVFAASVLLVLMLGGGIYKTISDQAQDGYAQRTCLSYLWSKVKTGDKSGSVFVSEFNGASALCLEEEYDGVLYKTLIYQHNGWVYELFYESGLEFDLDSGMQVTEIDALSFEALENGSVKAVCAESGREMSLILTPRSAADIPLIA